ncbi:MAG: cytidine deaminase [Firmicutes bacterium]|nr:cytidine deaminase [Bacillota bacterium]
MDKKELYDRALTAAEHSYAPYSGFHVGAAVLTEDGSVYTGCNIENASYPAGICAERTAMAKALSEGHRKFKKIVVAARNEEGEQPAAPCGICRQFIFEFGDDIEITFGPDRDHLQSMTIADLLPEGFRL